MRGLPTALLGFFLLGIVVSVANTAQAQTDDDAQKVAMVNPDANAAGQPTGPTCTGDATALFFPLDGTYSLVDFFGDGPTGSGPAQGPDQHNDDDSAQVALPFTFDLYGDLYTTAFINNNGNISFGTFFSTFSAVGFPSVDFAMVAPFWGDVDTGNPSNFIGDVWHRFFDANNDSTDETLVITWDNVGYYNEHGDLRSTFQLAISNGTNPVMGLGNNVCFSWDNMCWTTGDASFGVGGFGGTPATVGANRGDGVEFFQLGRFDHEGIDSDGQFGNPDGVSFLDFGTTCFNTAVVTNIAPIAQGMPAGNKVTLDAAVGDVLNLAIQFISPEAGQTVTVAINDVDGVQAAGLSISNNSPQLETVAVSLNWTPGCSDAGSYALVFTATDNFNPPGETVITLDINVLCVTGACCWDAFGTCENDVTPAGCIYRYGGDGSTCATISPPCLPPPICGDDSVNQSSEVCDGTDDAACPGLCRADCTCPPPPICGDDSVNQSSEVCDGTDDAACPGECRADCTCPPLPICGDNAVNQPSESCDGTDDAACPGECRADCTCPPLPICGDNVVNQSSEACDGSDDAACPGQCRSNCTCPAGEIPTVSQWGLIVIALMLLVGARVYFGRRSRVMPSN